MMAVNFVRTCNNIRATAYTATPLVLAALVSGHVLTQDRANLWAALAIAVLSPTLAAKMTPDRWRTYFFGILAAAQALLIGLGIFTDEHVTLWAAIANAIIGSAVATANVHERNPAQVAPAGDLSRGA